ncbi:hypothetical protein QZH41_002097 [Actinostola sp. cb2023]|nr:hypothetical protein QZH41_002097 [Actinostola sp. cb2023]
MMALDEMKVMSLYNPDDLIQYPLDKVEYVKDLGEGNFGQVFQGRAFGLHPLDKPGTELMVAVKTLKSGCSTDMKVSFLKEVTMMSVLHHDNIVELLAVSTEEEPYGMIFEFMVNGDLNQYLRAYGPYVVNETEASKENIPTKEDLLSISLQVANGMEYLQNMRLVHRDLATRNCLVGHDRTVKIADFGMSRDVYASDYYKVRDVYASDYYKVRVYASDYYNVRDVYVSDYYKVRDAYASDYYKVRDVYASDYYKVRDVYASDYYKVRDVYVSDYYKVEGQAVMPIRWMPPEALLFGKFTVESDVYSYGVLLWEIYTYALQPYYGYTNEEVVAFIKKGVHLGKPDDCEDYIYDIMKYCWNKDPSQRLNFQKIKGLLKQEEESPYDLPDEPTLPPTITNPLYADKLDFSKGKELERDLDTEAKRSSEAQKFARRMSAQKEIQFQADEDQKNLVVPRKIRQAKQKDQENARCCGKRR